MAATNSVYVLEPLGRIIGRYDKAHLVPYGEYLPMRPVAVGDRPVAARARRPRLRRPGPGPRTIEPAGGWGKVGFQLCYEIIFSGEVVDRAQPARLHLQSVERRLVRPLGPAAALAQARLRATEEGCP